MNHAIQTAKFKEYKQKPITFTNCHTFYPIILTPCRIKTFCVFVCVYMQYIKHQLQLLNQLTNTRDI